MKAVSVSLLLFAEVLLLVSANLKLQAGDAPVAAAPAAGGPNAIVELPPLEVEVRVTGHPWSYAESSGFEVLSRCSDSITKEFLEAQNRASQLFKLIVPETLQFRVSAPTIIVLSNRSSTPAASQELLASSLAADRPPAHEDLRGLRLPPASTVRFMPNLRLADVDAFAVYAIIDETTFDADHLELAREHAYFLLTQRTPPLPGWFVTGVLGLFDTLHFEPGGLAFSPANWTSPEEAERLRTDASAPRTLIPLVDFFGTRPSGTTPETAELDRVWYAQATLFVRWALDPKNGVRRDALWNFVNRSAGMTPTEDLFRACFGWGYAEMRDRLSDYLPSALKNSFRLRPEQKISFAPPKIREASPAEIGRLKGEWERLEAVEVRNFHPQFASRYVDQAERTLQSIYTRGERDPRFLAVKGLFECDQGRDSEARPLLEAAAAWIGINRTPCCPNCCCKSDQPAASDAMSPFSQWQVASMPLRSKRSCR